MEFLKGCYERATDRDHRNTDGSNSVASKFSQKLLEEMNRYTARVRPAVPRLRALHIWDRAEKEGMSYS